MRKRFLSLLVIGFTLALFTGAALPDTDPSKPIALPKPERTSAIRENRIRSLIQGEKPGKRIISIVVHDSGFATDPPGTYKKVVFVKFEQAESWSDSTTKYAIERDMIKIYKALFMSSVPIWRIKIEAQMELIDKFGKPSIGRVYGTMLDDDVADRVNWANAEILEWDQLWHTYFMNQAFR